MDESVGDVEDISETLKFIDERYNKVIEENLTASTDTECIDGITNIEKLLHKQVLFLQTELKSKQDIINNLLKLLNINITEKLCELQKPLSRGKNLVIKSSQATQTEKTINNTTGDLNGLIDQSNITKESVDKQLETVRNTFKQRFTEFKGLKEKSQQHLKQDFKL